MSAWNRPRTAPVPATANVSKAYQRCDRCERRVLVRDWPTHYEHAQCRSAVVHLEYEARGWAQVKEQWAAVIRGAGLPIEQALGGWHHLEVDGKLTVRQHEISFAPQSAVHACFLLANYRMTPDARARCVRMVHDEPHIFEASNVVYRTHGSDEARRYLVRMMRELEDRAEAAREQANEGGYRG